MFPVLYLLDFFRLDRRLTWVVLLSSSPVAPKALFRIEDPLDERRANQIHSAYEPGIDSVSLLTKFIARGIETSLARVAQSLRES